MKTPLMKTNVNYCAVFPFQEALWIYAQTHLQLQDLEITQFCCCHISNISNNVSIF